MIRRRHLSCLVTILLLLCVPRLSGQEAQGDFATVRKLLEQHCLACHGGHARRSGLSFANHETFLEGGARGPVLGRDGAPHRLIEVLSYGNPDLAMPPSGVLSEEDRAVIAAWVAAGAPWPDGPEGQLADPRAHEHEEGPQATGSWWAYEPLPAAAQAATGEEHALDAALRRAQERGGFLELADQVGEADPVTLLRRVTFDLTGLPPELAEVRAFLEHAAADGVDAAFAAKVDALLATPAYGEHMARKWLDLVRYAETNGYERDAKKPNIWRYRDWVVRAFAQGMPYDEFLTLQLAGDELYSEADPTVDARAAEALIATGYYRLGVWDDEPADREQARADELADIVDTTGQVFLGTTFGCARCHDHKADPISQADYFAFTAWFNNLVGYAEAGAANSARNLPDHPRDGQWTVAQAATAKAEADAALKAAADQMPDAATRLAAVPEVTLVADGRGTPATWRYREGAPPEGFTMPGYDDAAWAEGPGGFGKKGTPGARITTPWTSEWLAIRTSFRLEEIPAAAILSFHHDEDIAVWINGQLVLERRGYRGDYAEVALGREALDALVVGRNVLVARCHQTNGGQFLDVGLRTGDLGGAEGAWLARIDRLMREDPEAAAAAGLPELLAARAAVLAHPVAAPYPALAVHERGPVARPQAIHRRGSVHAPGEELAPGLPLVLRARGDELTPLPRPVPTAHSSGRRRALASWMVGDGAFLTARVMANRIWQWTFGAGLCRSPGDFGRLGEAPAHPEILDDLARRLIAADWSVQALQRHLLTSRAYRRQVQGPAELLVRDDRNETLWRRNLRRLTAEEYRDAVLAVSGALNTERFGPSVTPPLPAEVLATASRPDAVWGRATPEEAARRSLYIHVKRSLRMPLLAVLDQPDPDLPCPERFPTNVPTQALLTMNGAFTQREAERFAARLEGLSGDLEEQVRAGLEIGLSRPAEAATVARHVAFVQRLEAEHGCSRPEALRLFALGVFNLNAFIWLN